MLLASCLVALFDLAPSHFSPVRDIRILLIPTMCIRVKPIAFGNKEHTTDYKLSLGFIETLYKQ